MKAEFRHLTCHMETRNNSKNPFTAFSNFALIPKHHQQVCLNLILSVGNDKMKNEVLSEKNRVAYPDLEWPLVTAVRKPRPSQEALKTASTAQVRSMFICY